MLETFTAIFRQIGTFSFFFFQCALFRSRQSRSLWSHRISASIEASTLIPAWQDHYGKWRERVPPHFKSPFLVARLLDVAWRPPQIQKDFSILAAENSEEVVD